MQGLALSSFTPQDWRQPRWALFLIKPGLL
jgi:hypothetical protein